MNHELAEELAAVTRVMLATVKDSRARKGKTTEAIHYERERDLTTSAVLGRKVEAEGADLTLDQVALLVTVRTANTWLLRVGMPYKARCKHLFAFAGC